MPNKRGWRWDIVQKYDCHSPNCGARKGQYCRNKDGVPRFDRMHQSRLDQYRADGGVPR